MSNRVEKYFKICFGILFLIYTYDSSGAEKDTAQSDKAGEYSLVVYAGGGMSIYATTPGVPDQVETKQTTVGVSGTIRLMWQPDHLLRLGIESGQIPFYSYTINDKNYSGELKLSAVPLLLEWSMPIGNRCNVFLGYGVYFLNSKLDYAGVTKSSTRSIGLALAANYVHPISDNIGIGGEVKWMNATETKNKILNLQIQLVWKFFKW
jgi:hypothetical protein